MTNFDTLIFGTDEHGSPVSMPISKLNRHVYITGKSGSGKSTLLKHLAVRLIEQWALNPLSIVVLDPHASLYSEIIGWMAENGYDHTPVIPFDLRSDWVCSLNVLRPRQGEDPIPYIHGAVSAFLGSCRQQLVTDTPRLVKWLMAIMSTIYDARCTLLESLDIIRSPEIRAAMARHVEDVMAKSVWQVASTMKEAAIQVELESTMNRLGRFLATRVLRLAFSQSDVSLDMNDVFRRGAILLASLATEGSHIAEEDAAVVGSLLINEIFFAAKHRGKNAQNSHRQVVVIVDEFQEYISPVIATSLAQLRGMGVGFVMAHQSPQQLLDLGPVGRQTLNAVISNTDAQVIFQTPNPADLDILTRWIYGGKGGVDPNQIKHQPYSTNVLEYELRYFESTNYSKTHGVAESENWNETEGTAYSAGVSHTRGTNAGIARGGQNSVTCGTNSALALGSGQTHAKSAAESSAAGTTEALVSGRNRQHSSSRGDNRHLDGGYDDLAKVIGPEPSASFDKAYVDEDKEHRALHRAISKSESEAKSESDSHSRSLATTNSTSTARATEDARSQSVTLSSGTNESATRGQNQSHSFQINESETCNESQTMSRSAMRGGSHTESDAETHGVSRSPMLVPIIGREAGSPQFRSVEEQLFIFGQFLAGQPDRHAVVRVGTALPVLMTTPTIEPTRISAKGAHAWTVMKLKRLPFAFPILEAARRLEERRKHFEAKYLGSPITDEPTTHVRYVRKIKE